MTRRAQDLEEIQDAELQDPDNDNELDSLMGELGDIVQVGHEQNPVPDSTVDPAPGEEGWGDSDDVARESDLQCNGRGDGCSVRGAGGWVA